jgi:hypothetical protein
MFESTMKNLRTDPSVDLVAIPLDMAASEATVIAPIDQILMAVAMEDTTTLPLPAPMPE